MKRVIALLLILCGICVTAAADNELRVWSKSEGYTYVALGKYPQTIDGGLPEENGNPWKWDHSHIDDLSEVTVNTEPILWRVLAADDEKVYLCSEYVLFAMPMHVNYTEFKTIGADFGNTELSRYLNGTFLADAFTAEEQCLLLPCETYGKVFLLDSADVKNKKIGMGNGSGMKAFATEYAVRVTRAFVYSKKSGHHSPYWVRNQADGDKRHARCTKGDGTLGHIVSDRDNEGVRPAVYLAAGTFEIVSGTGVKTDPYVIVPKPGPAAAAE